MEILEKLEETPMPETNSKLSYLDYNNFVKHDKNRLTCPECDIVPALFIEQNSKNLFYISSGCENKHVIHDMSLIDFYKKAVKNYNENEKELNALCQKHNAKYEIFCKTCHKNICNQCADKKHQNHTFIKFDDIKPSNEEIDNLKNSIKNEIKITTEFLKLEFYRWLNELEEKFNDIQNKISYKNKLYNQIITNYETGSLNYQVIHNLKIIIKEQISRNPITKELANLCKISINANKNNNKAEIIFNEEKAKQFFDILNIEKKYISSNNNDNNNNNIANINMRKSVTINQSTLPIKAGLNINVNNNSNVNNNAEKMLTDFMNNPVRKTQNENYNKNINYNQNNNMNNNQNNNYNTFNNNNKYNYNNNQNKVLNPFDDNSYNNNNNNYANNNRNYNNYYNNNYNSNLQNNNFNYNNYQMNNNFSGITSKKLLNQTNTKEFIHCITLIRTIDLYLSKFAVGLENGTINIYKIDEISGEVSLDFEIKEFEKPISCLVSLNNGNLASFSFDKKIKIIEICSNQNVLLSIFRKYNVIQTITGKEDSFYYTAAIEMRDGTIVTGDWKNIMLYKNSNNGDGNNEYKQINQIVINNRISCLLAINENIFVSAFYDLNMINFYDIKNNNTRTIKNVKCTDDAQNCLCIININITETEIEDVLVIGGPQCMYFISARYQTLINRLFLPEVTYFKVIKNCGINGYGCNVICSGLFNQYSTDLVCYKISYQRAYNKFNLMEGFRIKEADHGTINSIVFVKSKGGYEDVTQKDMFVITGGMEKVIKVYA